MTIKISDTKYNNNRRAQWVPMWKSKNIFITYSGSLDTFELPNGLKNVTSTNSKIYNPKCEGHSQLFFHLLKGRGAGSPRQKLVQKLNYSTYYYRFSTNRLLKRSSWRCNGCFCQFEVNQTLIGQRSHRCIQLKRVIFGVKIVIDHSHSHKKPG